MTAIFIGLLVFILMTVFIVNTGFLGRYYMSHKQKDLIEMYEAMSEAVNNGNLGNEAVQKKLVAELEKTNIDVCAMDPLFFVPHNHLCASRFFPDHRPSKRKYGASVCTGNLLPLHL